MTHTEAFLQANTETKSQSAHTAPPASLTCIVGEASVVHVKQEPSLLPGLDPPPSLCEEARAASRREPQVVAADHPVTQRLHVGPQVKVRGQEEGQAALLEGNMACEHA